MADSPNWMWQTVLNEETGLNEVTPYSTGYTGWKTTPYWGTALQGKSPSEITTMMQQRGTDKTPESLWSIFKNGMYNNFKENPVAFAGGVVGLGGGLWNAYNDYRNQKKYMQTMQDAYNLQKQLALNAEQRNQEQWDMTKRQRASSSL